MILGSPRRILITGAGGFVGRHLVGRLRSSPDVELLAVGNTERGQDVVGLDIRDEAATQVIFEEFAPDCVVHLAASSSVAAAENAGAETWSVNFDGARSVIAAMKRLAKPTHLVFASSSEVYGRAFLNGPCSEDTPPQPQSIYARSKYAAELMLKDFATSNCRVTVLRLFNHTGTGQDLRFVVPSFAAQIAKIELGDGVTQMQVGNLEAERDFSDIGDVIDAYTSVLNKNPGKDVYNTYNVGSGHTRSIGNLLEQMISLSSANITPLLDPARLRPSDIPRAAGSFSAMQKTFGWSARRDISETLESVLDEQRAKIGSAKLSS